MYLRKSNICSHKLNAQEPNISSTEPEVILLDAGLRMDGLPALDLWDVVIEVLHSSKNTKTPTRQTAGNRLRISVPKLKKER